MFSVIYDIPTTEHVFSDSWYPYSRAKHHCHIK